MSDPNVPITGTELTGKMTVSAREISKWSMTIASLWIGGLHILKALWGLISEKDFGLDSTEIILSGLSLAAVFTPVYFSILLDKIRDIRAAK